MRPSSGNPKAEGRRPKEARGPKSEGANSWAWNSSLSEAEIGGSQRSQPFSFHGCEGAAGSCLRVSDFFRVSDFGLRIWRLDATESAENPLH